MYVQWAGAAYVNKIDPFYINKRGKFCSYMLYLNNHGPI